MPNFSDAEPLREQTGVIPDGTFVKLVMMIRPGGVVLPNEDKADDGLFRQSKSSNVVSLDCEFKVVVGEHRGRAIFRPLTMTGGQLDDKGVSKGWGITKSFIRSVLDSAQGLDPKDVTPATNAKRVLPNYSCLGGIEFAARTGIELGGDDGHGGIYPDRTTIAAILTVHDEEYQQVMRGDGDKCTPKPAGVRRARSSPVAGASAWNSGPAQPAAAQPAAAWTPSSSALGPGIHAGVGALPSWVTVKS